MIQSDLVNHVRKGDIDVIKKFVKEGGNVDDRNSDLLRHAVDTNQDEIVMFLLQKNINIHGGDNHALRIAIDRRSIVNARALLERGANVHAFGIHHNDNKMSFIEVARKNNDAEMVVLLKQYGAIEKDKKSSIPNLFKKESLLDKQIRMLEEQAMHTRVEQKMDKHAKTEPTAPTLDVLNEGIIPYIPPLLSMDSNCYPTVDVDGDVHTFIDNTPFYQYEEEEEECKSMEISPPTIRLNSFFEFGETEEEVQL